VTDCNNAWWKPEISDKMYTSFAVYAMEVSRCRKKLGKIKWVMKSQQATP
jgi:hypothetical protein